MTEDRPHVMLLTTGGTIANPQDVDGYIGGEELLSNVPEVEEIADVSVVDVERLGSQELTPRTLFTLHDRITEAATEGIEGEDGGGSGDGNGDPPDGFVVTSGSNTNEEIAYFLALTLDVDRPVVTTAAQRNHRLIGNDGDRNLLDAVRVAGRPEAQGRSVMLVANDTIHDAREATKAVTSRTDAWSSGDRGALGFTDKYGRVEFSRRSEREHTTATPFDPDGYDPSALRRIRVLYSTLGADGGTVDAAVGAETDGLVVAAFPTGNPANPVDYRGQKDALVEAAEDGTPVAISHRGHEGWTYAYRKEFPFIDAGSLTPQKARLLLYLALQETDDLERVQSFFDRF